MNIYDPIAIALNIAPIQFDHDTPHGKETSLYCGASFPASIYGTQDRSFMQTEEYKTKQSNISKVSWANSAPERKAQARQRIQKSCRKKVYAEGVVYDSLTLCASNYNVCLETIRLWMRKGKDFRYI